MKAWLLRSLGLTGTLLFGTLLLLTAWRPVWLEEAARGFIADEVRAQVRERIDFGGGDALDLVRQGANALLKQEAARAAVLKAEARQMLDSRIAAALARISDVQCECRQRLAALAVYGISQSLSWTEAADARLTEFVQVRYLRVVGELKRDIRIFAATNAAACLLLLLLSFSKPQALNHLVLPGVLLAASVIACSYFYVFEQNWFYTLVYADYVGYAYLGYLGLAFGLLLDITFNRGRVTTGLVNTGAHAVGSSLSLLTC